MSQTTPPVAFRNSIQANALQDGEEPPNPQFVPGWTMAQLWADSPATQTVFPHNPLPGATTPWTTLLYTDREKLRGWINAAEWVAPAAQTDAYAPLQGCLLYAQLLYRALCGTGLDNVASRRFVDVHLPAGNYTISQPLVIPRNVRFGGPGRIIPTPFVGPQTGLTVNGIYNGTVNPQTNYLPLVVVAPQGHLSDLNLYVSGYTGGYQYKTSGLVIGKNWQAVIGAACTIGSPGAGYTAGQQYEVANPDVLPYSPMVITVVSVTASGGITAANVELGGAYSLPPAAAVYNGAPGLQESQWTPTNGFTTVFDSSVPSALLVASLFGGGGAPGAGASIIPPWQPDFAPGAAQYLTGSESITNGTQAGRIDVAGAVENNYDLTGKYGPTFNVQISGLETEIESIRGLNGRVGLWCIGCQDVRISRLNFVGSATAAWFRYFGSIVCPLCVFDTCGQVLVLDQGHSAILQGRAFYEEGNLKPGCPPINIGNSTAFPNGGTIMIGQGSTAAAPVNDCDIEFTLHNMGGLPQSTITAYGLADKAVSTQAALVSMQWAQGVRIRAKASNYAQYGRAVASPMPAAALFQVGPGVDRGCILEGNLDTLVAIDGAPIPTQIVNPLTGNPYPACRIDVEDTYHQCAVGRLGIVQMTGQGVPVNGATGANVAPPGSTYTNSTPVIAGNYVGTTWINKASLSSPTWAQIA